MAQHGDLLGRQRVEPGLPQRRGSDDNPSARLPDAVHEDGTHVRLVVGVGPHAEQRRGLSCVETVGQLLGAGSVPRPVSGR